MSALPTSRRAVLSGLASFTAFQALPLSADTLGQDVEALWCEWLVVNRAMNTRPMSVAADTDDPDSPVSRLFARMTALEESIAQAAPSLMRAAASAMIEASVVVDFTAAPSAEERGASTGGWLALHILPCLRPHLFGQVARCAADLVDNPDRPMRDSVLFAGIEPPSPA